MTASSKVVAAPNAARAAPFRVPPEGLLAASIVSIQAGSALATTLFDQMGPAGIAFLKTAFAASALACFSRAWRVRVNRDGVRLLVTFGAIVAVMFASSYETLARLPMGVAATIGFLGPLGLAVAHSRRLIHFVWTALAGAGLLLLTPDLLDMAHIASPSGVLWGLLSAAAWAAFILMSPRVGAVVPGLRGLAVAMGIATFLLAPYALLTGKLGQLSLGDFGMAGLVAGLTAIVPTSLEFTALRRISARGYGMVVSTEPGIAALAGAILIGQLLKPGDWLGICFVCVASAGMTWTDRRG